MVQKKNKLEIRKYPELVIASTSGDIENSAFSLLFNYINGNNKSKRKISMTAPVISKRNYMAFILPSKYTKETAPIPLNSNVNIDIIPKRTIAVLHFSGKTNEKSLEKQTLILKEQLKKPEWQTVGDVFLMRYNSPFTPGFLRRNELGIEIVMNEK